MEHVEANLRDNDAAAVTLEQRTLRALKDADRTARLLKHLFERDGAVDIVAAFSKGLIRPDAYLVVSICDAGGHVILSSEGRAVGRHAAPGDVGAQRHRRGHAHVLARHCTRLKPDEATLAGIVHKIGVLLILTYAENAPHLLQNVAALRPRSGRGTCSRDRTDDGCCTGGRR